MIRSLSLIAVAAGVLMAPLAAQALGISIVNVSSSGASTTLLDDGDVLTVDLLVENSGGLDIFGAGLAVRGLDTDGNGIADSGINVTGGTLAPSMFNVVQGFGGLENVRSAPDLRGSPGVPLPPTNPFYVPPSEVHAVFFEGVALSAVDGDGSLDPGVDGGSTGAGEAHFRIVFTASTAGLGIAPSLVVLEFGTHAELGHEVVGSGGAVLPFNNDSLTVRIVPEPGTALLMGLGLAGLAIRRR